MLLETPRPELGTPAPDFTLKDAHGQSFGRNDVAGSKGLLVGFICNHCPYVIALADRLAEDIDNLASVGIGTVLINSNDYQSYPADAPDKMPGFLEHHGLNAPYLVDETQDVARAYGAVCTPDFFGYDADMKLAYRGRLDDAGRGGTYGRTADLLNAMQAVAQSAEVSPDQIPSMGCSLKWR